MSAPYLGNYTEDEIVYFTWTTEDAAGAATTRTADGIISIYKDNNATQTTLGITDTKDFDSVTGLHACTIDTSTDAFYATGSEYAVVVSAAEIDGQIINAPIAHFSIGRFAGGGVRQLINGGLVNSGLVGGGLA